MAEQGTPIDRLKTLAARLRKVQPGDLILADDHNTLVDSIHTAVDALQYLENRVNTIQAGAGPAGPASGKTLFDLWCLDEVLCLLPSDVLNGFMVRDSSTELSSFTVYMEGCIDNTFRRIELSKGGAAFIALKFSCKNGYNYVDFNKLANLYATRGAEIEEKILSTTDFEEVVHDVVFPRQALGILAGGRSEGVDFRFATVVRLGAVYDKIPVSSGWFYTSLSPPDYVNIFFLVGFYALESWGIIPQLALAYDINGNMYRCEATYLGMACEPVGALPEDWFVVTARVQWVEYQVLGLTIRVLTLDGNVVAELTKNINTGSSYADYTFLLHYGGIVLEDTEVVETDWGPAVAARSLRPFELHVDWLAVSIYAEEWL